MHARTHLCLAVGFGVLLPGLADAQGVWVPHQPPCKLSTGHYLVKGSMIHLKLAVESQFADSRASRVAEARKVLDEAILQKGQDQNAAAWYYLGRAYTLGNDFAGADSAFRRVVALAPECAADVAQYRSQLATLALTDALRTWGAGVRDSAVAFFRLARSLDTTDAEIPLYASLMYAGVQEPDSAARYLEMGLAAAETDTAHGARLRQAELEVARAYETRAATAVPAVRTVAQTRLARDTTARHVARDSALLNRIVSDIAAMRAQGGRLTPQARAAFERDSTMLEDRLTAGRTARDSLAARARSDSAAVTAALAPAAAVYAAYTTRYPGDADAALQLLRLHVATGDRAALGTVVERLVTSAGTPGSTLLQASLSLYGDGLYEEARRMADAALAHNPNDHAALGVATHVSHALGDAAGLRKAADRRLALAPLDPGAARAVALACDLAGQPDSASQWLAVADTGLAWNVHVTQFQPTEHAASLNGYVRNAVPRTLPALDLVFEFLGADGSVLAAIPVSIPALEPRGRAPLTVRGEQGGAVSWRYRRP
jgi:tetratricopeptide (TPR) repeat protein